MVSKRWNNKTENIDTSKNQQSNLAIYESFNQFVIFNILSCFLPTVAERSERMF